MKVTEAAITGEGSYTVGLDFTGTPEGAASGIAFAAIGLENGEKVLPGWTPPQEMPQEMPRETPP